MEWRSTGKSETVPAEGQRSMPQQGASQACYPTEWKRYGVASWRFTVPQFMLEGSGLLGGAARRSQGRRRAVTLEYVTDLHPSELSQGHDMSVISKFAVQDDEGTRIDIYEHGSELDALRSAGATAKSISVFRTQNGGSVWQIDENTFRTPSGKTLSRVLI